METEEVDTNPSMEEMVAALSGKLAARETQMAAMEIKIAKLEIVFKRGVAAYARLEKKLAKLKE